MRLVVSTYYGDMSYIRALSNPEGLYIYHDIGGYIAIYGARSPSRKPTRREEAMTRLRDPKVLPPMKAPVRDFNAILRAFWTGAVGYGGTGRIRRGCLTLSETRNYKVRLSRRGGCGWSIEMYLVTMEHIADDYRPPGRLWRGSGRR